MCVEAFPNVKTSRIGRLNVGNAADAASLQSSTVQCHRVGGWPLIALVQLLMPLPPPIIISVTFGADRSLVHSSWLRSCEVDGGWSLDAAEWAQSLLTLACFCNPIRKQWEKGEISIVGALCAFPTTLSG